MKKILPKVYANVIEDMYDGASIRVNSQYEETDNFNVRLKVRLPLGFGFESIHIFLVNKWNYKRYTRWIMMHIVDRLYSASRWMSWESKQ